MPIFQYTAMDSSGKEKKGKMDADNEQAVGAALKEQGMFPTSIKAAKGTSSAKKSSGGGGGGGKKKGGSMLSSLSQINIGTPVIKKKDLTIMTRQLAILLDAGLPLVRSLKTLEHQTKNPIMKKILGETSAAVEGGLTFSESLAQNPKSFDKLYLNMIKAGEAAGALEGILDRLAAFMEKAMRMAGKIKSAMVYPVMVMIMAIGITSALLVFIVPKFKKIFQEMLNGEPLPWLTDQVMGLSDTLMNNLVPIIGTLIGAFILFKIVVSTKKGRWIFDWMKYNAPLFGPIISKSAISRFSRTLGTLMGAGVPVLQALQIVRDTAGNEVVSSAVQKVHDAVKEGEPMAPPLDQTKIFPSMVISMIEVGEETGKLPEMMAKIADTYDEEVDLAVDALTSMIEPLMIMFLAVVIGSIVIAMFLPLISIVKKLGGG
ncbi:MAG: type II secretion system F family protein [Kiritimatiellaeota bacterium]|nr:type II secretion system F family protein [Kiritimatiellota bacterium]